jgi:hypothetical protein
MSEPRRRGRPHLGDDTRREQRSIRLLPETWARLEALAAEAGSSVGKTLDRLLCP